MKLVFYQVWMSQNIHFLKLVILVTLILQEKIVLGVLMVRISLFETGKSVIVIFFK